MRPPGTTHADEVRRHDRLIERIARRPAIRKLQRAIDAVAELWQKPDHLHLCLGGRVHWRVQPSSDAVEIVGAHHSDDRIHVRRAVLAALRHATPHGAAAAAAIEARIADPDELVRIHAARAAADLHLGPALVGAIVDRLDDPVWVVRWNTARALAETSLGPKSVDVLLRSQPPAEYRGFDEWVFAVRAFPWHEDARERLALLERLPP